MGHLWGSLLTAFVVWNGFVHPLRLLDFWWHLKIGEIIVHTRSIPRTDLFSFTAAGKPFVLGSWLAEALYYVVYLIGGLPLLVFLNTAMITAALLIVYRLCWEASGRLRLSALAASLAALPLAFLFSNMRPQVFSFVLLAIFYWVLSGYRFRRRDLLWGLPPLMVLWVNVHGAFALGLGLIGLFLGSEAARRLVHGPRSDTLSIRELRKLGLILLASVAAVLVNPETYGVFSYVHSVLTAPVVQWSVVEHQPPRIDMLEGIIAFYGPFFITLLVLLRASRRPGLTDLALFLVFAVFALTARRNGIWFVLIIAPIVARYLPTVEVPKALKPLRRWGAAAPRPRFNALIAAVLLAVTVAVSPWIYPRLGTRRLGSSLLDSNTPVGAMDYMERRRLRGNVFHPQIYGDYLIWRLWPQQRSFVDARTHLFSAELIRDYLRVFSDPRWEERLSRYAIRYLLLSKNEKSPLRMADDARASPGWRLLYEDDRSVLFEKAPGV